MQDQGHPARPQANDNDLQKQAYLQAQSLRNQEMLKIQRDHNKEVEMENYYNNLLVWGLVGIMFYFIGAGSIIFLRNVGGSAVVNLPSQVVTWELFFRNFPEFFRNFLVNIFGYFIEYAKLFGYFENIGNKIDNPRPAFMMPVDVIIKLATIWYFNSWWRPWDNKRSFKFGIFNRTYPYIKRTPQEIEENEKIEAERKRITEERKTIQTQVFPQYENNPYYKAQLARLQQQQTLEQAKSDDDDEDDEPEGILSFLPFKDIFKPLEEWYYDNEKKIYNFIRNQILPGSNLVLAFYFSALYVLDLRQPLGILLYILGITSMFWCMQTFLIILDHNQYPPEEDGERF